MVRPEYNNVDGFLERFIIRTNEWLNSVAANNMDLIYMWISNKNDKGSHINFVWSKKELITLEIISMKCSGHIS